MEPILEIPTLNLDDPPSAGSESFSNDPSSMNAVVASASAGTKDEKNFIRDGDIDYRIQMKRHTEKENEISIGDQVRWEKNSRQSFNPFKTEHTERESERKRHLADGIGNESCVSSATEIRRSPRKAEPFQDGPPHSLSTPLMDFDHLKRNQSDSEVVQRLKTQNHQLLQALAKVHKSHATEKKRFNDILFGIDRALSSLPIRLEKIRVRNQRNLSIINTSRFHSGDGSENRTERSTTESNLSDESVTGTSQESQMYLSARMKCLLQKMDQLNDLIHTIKQGDASPIELLVKSELCAISLLKKEIKTTKKQIDDNKTDTETASSCEESEKKELTEDSSSKAKNSFSNELNKASNFKIFENHMILQEEALNLLTRKIKETEEALTKEVEAKEGLKRENEAMAKEIFRLKSTGEESKGEKSEKMEKLKPEAEATGNRPYRLIKELKTKLEEKEKSLIAWKSKCSRLEAAGANKTILIENEKKKNSELENIVKNLRSQNKSTSCQVNSLQFLNDQLRDQVQILKQQVEILANGGVEMELNSATRSSKMGEQISESLQTPEDKTKKIEKEFEKKIKELESHYENELEQIRLELVKYQNKSEEFSETFKELFINIQNFALENEVKHITRPTHDRIREILNITPSDLRVLYSVYLKSTTENEAERLYDEFKSIVDNEEEFSKVLSTWFFTVIREKLLDESKIETNRTEV